MARKPNTPKPPVSTGAQRRADALRENLRRRKRQQRLRHAPDTPDTPNTPDTKDSTK